MSEPLVPTPELPDDTPLDSVELPTRIRNVLAAEGLKTVGDIREASDAMLLSLQDLGKGSVAHLASAPPMGSGPSAKSPPDLPI
jgi:DNA-directed RNA polymerase alpha subunit